MFIKKYICLKGLFVLIIIGNQHINIFVQTFLELVLLDNYFVNSAVGTVLPTVIVFIIYASFTFLIYD